MGMTQKFAQIARLFQDPTGTATDTETVDVSATDHTFTSPVRAVYVGVAGNITLINLSGNSQLFANVPVGILHVGAITIVKATTAATDMVGLY